MSKKSKEYSHPEEVRRHQREAQKQSKEAQKQSQQTRSVPREIVLELIEAQAEDERYTNSNTHGSGYEPIEPAEARERLVETRQEIEQIKAQLCFSSGVPQHLDYADDLAIVSTRIEDIENSIEGFQQG
jgi:hypothetical protein